MGNPFTSPNIIPVPDLYDAAVKGENLTIFPSPSGAIGIPSAGDFDPQSLPFSAWYNIEEASTVDNTTDLVVQDFSGKADGPATFLQADKPTYENDGLTFNGSSNWGSLPANCKGAAFYIVYENIGNGYEPFLSANDTVNFKQVDVARGSATALSLDGTWFNDNIQGRGLVSGGKMSTVDNDPTIATSGDYERTDNAKWMYADYSLDDSPAYSDYLDFGEIGRRYGGAGGQYFEGHIKQIMIFERPLTETELRNLMCWYEEQRNWLSVCVLGSSVAVGVATTNGNQSWAWHAYGNKSDVIYSNIGDPGKGTQHWIDNVDLALERYVQTIHMSLGLGNDSENTTTYLANTAILLQLLSNRKVVLSNNYCKRGAGNDQRRFDTNKTMDIDFSDQYLVVNMMGQWATNSDDFIAALNSNTNPTYDDDGTHGNDNANIQTGKTISVTQIKNYQYGILSASKLPNSVVNTSSSFYKPDATTLNPLLVTTRDLPATCTEFRLACTSDLTGKVLASFNNTGLTWEMFLDADNIVKVTDGTDTFSTSITNLTLDNRNVYSFNLNDWRALDVWVNGVKEITFDYTSPGNKTLSGNSNIVLGGKYGDNSNDAVDVYVDNIILHAAPNDPDRLAESGVDGFIVAASMDLYVTGDNLVIDNLAQNPDNIAVINDNNITIQNQV